MVFNGEQKEALVEYLVRCNHFFYGQSITELKELAYKSARKLNIIYPTNWYAAQLAGKTWYCGITGTEIFPSGHPDKLVSTESDCFARKMSTGFSNRIKGSWIFTILKRITFIIWTSLISRPCHQKLGCSSE